MFLELLEILFFIVILFKILYFIFCSNIKNFIRYLSFENDKRNVVGVIMFVLFKNFILIYV